jgi:glycosyltransferase involved in cell wall biosynthesis
MKKILVVLRHDAVLRPGGDTALLTDIARSLDGFESHVVNGVPKSVLGYEFALCANLDRPMEALHLLQMCQESDVPLHLMALHHNYDAMTKFFRFGLVGWKRYVAMFADFCPVRYEQLLWSIRVVSSFFFKGSRLKFGNVARAQKKLICESSFLLVVSGDELKCIERDIGPVSSKVVELPHLLNDDIAEVASSAKDKVIFCPGRIESRKNQLFILAVAATLPHLNFVFMGRVNSSEKIYYARFLDRASKLKNISILPPLNVSEFRVYLSKVDVVLTASWFEVTSLIELDVLRKGNKLVCGSVSYNDSFFSNSLIYLDNDIGSCRDSVLSAVEGDDFVVSGKYPSATAIINRYFEQIGVEK